MTAKVKACLSQPFPHHSGDAPVWLATNVMSCYSFAHTFALPPSEAATLADAINAGDFSLLDEHHLNKENSFQTSSRGLWIELHTHLLIEGFAPSGLGYLSHRFKGDVPDVDWFAATLNVPEVLLAAEGIRSLIANFSQDIAATSRLLNDVSISDEDCALLPTMPTSISDANERFKSLRAATGGDHNDIPSLIAFLQGHLSVLEFAHRNSLSVLYALWVA
jgi:hypothetical protein